MTAIYQVDAFAERPFLGNPAAVCPLDDEVTDVAWMQSLAAEMNLSETAYLWLEESGAWRLRWFTPEAEVELCGHATLAAAHVLWTSGRAAREEPIDFETASGRLRAARDGELVTLDFPTVDSEPSAPTPELDLALGAAPTAVRKGRWDLMVELPTADEVRRLRPDFEALRELDARGVIVTARADADDHDFVSRFFAPALGIDEDPVTGSAHCQLAPFWSRRLGRQTMWAHQVSRRGGRLRVRHDGDRVELAGGAVMVWSGELTAAAGPPAVAP